MSERSRFYQNNFEGVAPECVPYRMISPSEQVILQHVADGYTEVEIAENLFVSVKTVEAHKRNMVALGLPRDHGNGDTKATITALIIDGINNGYISHEHSGEQVQPLSKAEQAVMKEILSGYSEPDISEHLGSCRKTVEAHSSKIYTKLGLGKRRNRYHATARYTYLNLHGLLPEKK